jgi:hypothetical protein
LVNKPLQLLAVSHGLHQMAFILLLWFVLAVVAVVALTIHQRQAEAILTL